MAEQRTSGARRVLFIEDDTAVRDAVSRLLQGEGFGVETAPDANTGMHLARHLRHDAVLLDLVLPDQPGLILLAQLRREGILVPCVVLTGFPGSQSGFEAGRLGVVAYLEKPATAMELVAALRAATGALSAGGFTELFASRPISRSPLGNILLAEVAHVLDGGTNPSPREADEGLRVDLARTLARAAPSAIVTFSEFVAIATALRQLMGSHHATPLPDAFASIRLLFADAAARDALPTHREAERVISVLHAAGRGLRSLREDELASTLQVPVTQMGQILDNEYGLPYAACRLAVIMRKVVCELARGAEHVRQVAFHVGYDDHGNFDRAFRSFFGVTPTRFRKLRAGDS